jgi:hypothetical protein
MSERGPAAGRSGPRTARSTGRGAARPQSPGADRGDDGGWPEGRGTTGREERTQ